MNAMRTTAAHSFPSSSFVQTTDNLVAAVDTSATTTIRSSPTPAPTSQEPVPKIPIISQEANKGPAGSGKKKRKRPLTRRSIHYKYLTCISGTSLAPPPATTST